MKQSSLTLIIDKMEKKGFIERKAKQSDRRAYLICITSKGRQLEEPINKAVEDINKQSFLGINNEEKNTLLNILKKIDTNLK